MTKFLVSLDTDVLLKIITKAALSVIDRWKEQQVGKDL